MSLSLSRVFELARQTSSPADRRLLVNACEAAITLADLPSPGDPAGFSATMRGANKKAKVVPLHGMAEHKIYFAMPNATSLRRTADMMNRCPSLALLPGWTVQHGIGAEGREPSECTQVLTVIADKSPSTRDALYLLAEHIRSEYEQDSVLSTSSPIYQARAIR